MGIQNIKYKPDYGSWCQSGDKSGADLKKILDSVRLDIPPKSEKSIDRFLEKFKEKRLK